MPTVKQQVPPSEKETNLIGEVMKYLIFPYALAKRNCMIPSKLNIKKPARYDSPNSLINKLVITITMIGAQTTYGATSNACLK